MATPLGILSMSFAPPVMMVWTAFWIFSSACSSIGIAVSFLLSVGVSWDGSDGPSTLVLMLFALLGLRLLAVAGRVDLPFDGGQLALVPVAQGLATFHLAASLGHEVGVSLLDRVMQRDDGGLEFVVRFADLSAQQLESLGAVAAREPGPADRRVQRLRLAGEPVEA